jgi:phage gp36-like protein
MYCNVEDVRRRLPEVTTHILRDSTVAYFIDDAQSRIDARLRDIYDVPFTSAPDHIAKLTSLYAAYLTLCDYPDQYVEDDLSRMRMDINDMLDNLTSGKDSLGDEYKVSQPKSQPSFGVIKSRRYRKSNIYDQRDAIAIDNESEDNLLDTESNIYG